MKKIYLFVSIWLVLPLMVFGASDNRNGASTCQSVNSSSQQKARTGAVPAPSTDQQKARTDVFPGHSSNQQITRNDIIPGYLTDLKKDRTIVASKHPAGKPKGPNAGRSSHAAIKSNTWLTAGQVTSTVVPKSRKAAIFGHSTYKQKFQPGATPVLSTDKQKFQTSATPIRSAYKQEFQPGATPVLSTYEQKFQTSATPMRSAVRQIDTSSGEAEGINEKIKTGWTFGAVPAIAYDTDRGFKYGGLVNFYHFGDGKIYPKYRHSIYLEWSRTTRGSGINQFRYDSEYLIPNVRVTAEASYLTEKALDFYGFNGREVLYNPDFEDEDQKAEYISRMYYRHERDLLRLKADFQGSIIGRKLRWLAGFVHYGINTDAVDIANLNKGKDKEDLLPDTAGIFQKYVDWNIISGKEKDGGNTNFLKLGLVYDTRDNEPNPNSGMWTELLFNMAPGFLGNKDYSFTKLALTHRQYFTIFPKRLTLAYRLSYQPKISGDMPFYMLPFIYNSRLTVDGLGGKKTIRGILLNRLAGEGYAFGNIEFRWKFIKTVLFNQNIYVALSTFLDGGMVTDYYDIQDETINNLKSDNPAAYRNHFTGEDESLHLSYGTGLHFALNENFIVAVDYGRAIDAPDDGISGFYIGMDFLY